jgi:hypothetical protein
MKKCFILGVSTFAITSVITSCSKGSDLYDAGAVQQNQHEQKVAKLTQTYSDAFTKEFGTVASDNQWGFDQTTGRKFSTRQALTSSADVWIIPDNFTGGNQNAEGWNANGLDWNGSVKSLPKTLSDFDFSNYFLQHVEQPKGGNVKNGTQLQAYNSKTGNWEDVTNFSKGKSTNDFVLTGNYLDIEATYFIGGLNKSAARTTLMADMGGSPDNGNLFRVKDEVKNKGKVSYEYNYDYGFITVPAYHKESGEWVPAETFLVIEFPGNNHWIIRIGEAVKFTEPNPVVAEGRILCEDMGANDFDFNDVVFDATIMRTGEIKIKVLAHGGKLPIAIDGVDVTLGQMTNTGLNKANCQEFTIAAVNGSPKYASIDAIPVTVNPNGGAENIYNLEAPIGSAPQKICAPIGTLWPIEYTKLSSAYTPFTTWVSILDPAEWTYLMDPDLVFTVE